jgi:flagellar hook-length control protein FliK
MPSWIHAGSHTAEAGYQDPSLGWVGVRAEVSAGSIHASLVPGSADAAQVLSSHMAGLNNYLAEQHTPVATLTMAASSTGSQPDPNTGQNMQQGQNSGSEAQAHAATTTPASTLTAAPSTAAASPAASGSIETINPAIGHHISVMA